SHGYVAVLRLSHGGLLPALDQDAEVAQRHAENFSRKLVSQGRRGTVHLAGLQPEHAGVEMDCGPRARAGSRERDADRLGTLLRRHGVEWPRFPEGPFRRAAALR